MISRGTPADIAALKIGDTLYRFDGNRRVYPPKKPGELYGHGGPIYREHFAGYVIVAETKSSWIVDEHARVKVNKKTLDSARQFHLAVRGFFTKAAMENDIWLHDNRLEIAEAVKMETDGDRLKEIARILGYKAKP